MSHASKAAQPLTHSERRDPSRRTTRRLYDLFTSYVRSEIGVKLGSGKWVMVESRLRRRMQQLGFTTLDDYFSFVFEDGGLAEERLIIINAVTTNKTDFFRESAHFRHLVEHALPEAIRRRSGRNASVNIWSAAASTGAEAWTTAMCVANHAQNTAPFRWSILGTDVNTEVLEVARRAVYPDTFLEPVPAGMRSRWLHQGVGAQAGLSRIAPELRRHVRFHPLNLLDDDLALERNVDIIFLRNVLIYFTPEDQRRAIENVVSFLVPGGVLYLGHSESMMLRDSKLDQIAPATFRKKV